MDDRPPGTGPLLDRHVLGWLGLGAIWALAALLEYLPW
jgi:hypothetical protein